MFGGNKLQGGYLRIGPPQLRTIPIPVRDQSKSIGKRRHDRMVELVDKMLSFHKRLSSAARPHQKTVLERQIAATDQQIDRLVYELYELTDEEIKIVEEATGHE